MAYESSDTIRLQLAMAFGQGAGSMLANEEAIEYALSAHAAIIDRAIGNWEGTRPAFIELVRLLGQIAAARAASDGKPEIERQHVEFAIPGILNICPCRV
jgi:hypothetical protein